MNVLIEACARPSLLAIARIDSPRSSASQISALSASENLVPTGHLPLANQRLLFSEVLR
jgi:hypothetical protein